MNQAIISAYYLKCEGKYFKNQVKEFKIYPSMEQNGVGGGKARFLL